MDVIDISRAKNLYSSKDYARFMKYCLSFDIIEDGDTLDSMGICYRDGKGVKEDADKAISCFESALSYGYIPSAVRLGIIYRTVPSKKDLEKAIQWYKLAAEQGESDAMYNLAKIYYTEDIVKDIKKAIGWYEKAAKKGDTEAMLRLGIIYYDEEEVRDYNKTVEWYEKGSANGSASCMHNLGWVYKNNEELKDISKAIYWYKCSANCGHENGKYMFAKLVLENNVADEERNAYQALLECSVKGMDKALNLLTEKAKNGSSVAQFYLGRYYMEMTDVQEHEQIAFEWYKKSAVQGYIPAQNIILINQSENTSQTIKEIKIDTSTIVDTTAENSRKLDEIVNNLMSMNEKIADIRAKSFTGNADTEDNEISAALEKSAAVINNTVQDTPTDKLKKHTEHLVYLFGEQIWDRLLPETKQSLISSAYLLKECEGMPPEFDYSGICITAVVALEKELKRVFSDNYMEYLKEVRKYKDDELPYLFQNESYFFSLGKLAQLFGYDAKNGEVKHDFYARRMEEYLKTIVKRVFAYDPLLAFIEQDDPNCFIKRCLTINKSYRCKAAHCGNVSYDDALDCCYEIYGEASAHIDAKRQSAEIISLLRELFSKLK